MTIFALDSSSRAGSAAIFKDGALLAESYANIGLTHSETLMELADEVFRRAALTPAGVDYFAASAGPGSFTGLRIGLGLIKGLALPFDAPCVGLSTLECAAYNAADSDRAVVAALDARRDRVYCAAFTFKSGAPARLWPDEILELAELGERVRALARPVLFVGDAAEMCYTAIKEGADCALISPPLREVRASGVALAALRAIERGEIVSPDALAPVYLQLPQAERERLKKINDNGD